MDDEMKPYSIIRRFSALAAVALLSACNQLPDRMKPQPFLLRDVPPEGRSAEYRQHFKEGCETVFALFGMGPLRTFYEYSYDPQRIVHDDAYYLAWKDGQQHCIYWTGVGSVY